MRERAPGARTTEVAPHWMASTRTSPKAEGFLPAESFEAVMDLPGFTRDWEAREEALSLEYYNQYAGLPYSDQNMGKVSQEIQDLCRAGLDTWKRGQVPDVLYFAMVGNKEAREMTRLQNEVYRLRNEGVVVESAGEKVNLNNVRIFNFKHLRAHDLRRKTFEALMDKAKILTPVLKERFGLSSRTYAQHGLTPLDTYLVEEQVSRARLREVVDESGRRALPEFKRLGSQLSTEILGKPMEFYDDMYVYRASVYGPVDPAFKDNDYVAGMKKVARTLGFAVDAIGIDGEPRAGKYSSPVCFGVKIPGDVRVLYQRTSPFGDYESFYHEMGHGLHFISVDAKRAFHERRLIPNGVAEIFSTLFEELAVTPAFLREDIGLAESVITDLVRRRRFMELFFLTFYAANSMHKIRFWSEGLVDDFDKADAAYSDLTERYMGVRVPGIYWQTHHILSMSDMYAPSYLLANIRKSELIQDLVKRFGDRWWREPAAGRFLRDECMGPGGAIDLGKFSKLDADAYLKHVVAP